MFCHFTRDLSSTKSHDDKYLLILHILGENALKVLFDGLIWIPRHESESNLVMKKFIIPSWIRIPSLLDEFIQSTINHNHRPCLPFRRWNPHKTNDISILNLTSKKCSIRFQRLNHPRFNLLIKYDSNRWFTLFSLPIHHFRNN